MPSPAVNAVNSTDVFQEVVFTVPRPGFTVVVSNKAIGYQLGLPGSTGFGGDVVWESITHQLVPSLSSFNDPAKEGYPGIGLFSGFRFKSWLAGATGVAIVSVN